MSEIIFAISSYDFIMRAFVVGALIAVCAALLGVTLVLKRFSMIGDGLSHIGFGALSFASVIGFAPLKVAVPVVAVCAVLLLRFGGKKMKGDSMIAVISSGALALGIALISASGSGSDINSYLIGSIYAVSDADMTLAIVLSAVVVLCFVFLYTRIFAVTFDESFAGATGVGVDMCNTVIAILTAVTVVIGMRLVGSLLISALIVFPTLCAMRLFKSFFAVTLSTAIIGFVNFAVGFAITLVFDGIPTGACVTLVNLVVFAILTIFSVLRERIR